MTNFICATCGTQFAASEGPPAECTICQDPRQFVPLSGQQWTTLEQLRAHHRNAWQECEPGLIGIGSTPEFAIGQRALLLRTQEGNFLWDCVSLIDAATVDLICSLGGLRGIAISHPHFYTTMVEWSRAFHDVPIYLHAADRQWVMRPDPAIEFWESDRKQLASGLTLIRCGGHFPGGTVLHWREEADSRGVLLTGDILQVTPDRMLSFMFSYPNLTPLPAQDVRQIAAAVASLGYDRIYGAWWDRMIPAEAKEVVQTSVERYLTGIDSLGNRPAEE